LSKSIAFSLMLFLAINVNAFTIACAANFKPTLVALTKKFETIYGIENIKIVTGSSGMLYTQIKHGAPFDLFLSADEDRPLQLATDLGANSFIYAIGQLVFWQEDQNDVTQKSFENYKGRLAIANPKIAPYGIAALQMLDSMKAQKLNLVRGNNVNQSYQFVYSGNVNAGLLSLSQMILGKHKNYWLIPNTLYSPIRQRGIVVNQNEVQAIKFSEFLQSDIARTIIGRSGYGLPTIGQKSS